MISVVIATYNEEKYITRPLSSLMGQDFGGSFEVIVVNDCSSDRTSEIVGSFQKEHGNIRLVEMEKRSGVALASNRGVRETTGDVVAFLDADCAAREDWLHAIERRMGGHVAMVGPNSMGSYRGAFEKFYFQQSFDVMGSLLNLTNLPVCPMRSNCAFSRKAFEKIGGFRDVLAEDLDIAFRARKEGRIRYEKGMVVYATPRRIRNQGFFRTGGRNILAYLRILSRRPQKGLESPYFQEVSR